MHPIGRFFDEKRYNIDGYLTYAFDPANEVISYFQLYRNGIIESAENRYLDFKNTIEATEIEKDIIDSLSNYLNLLNMINVATPIFVFLTLVGVDQHKIYPLNVIRESMNPHPIGRDVLHLPELYLEEYPTRVDTALKPIFNALWNAGGYPEDPHYSDNTWMNPKPFRT